MASNKLIACKTCSKEVAESASTCPHCGAKLKLSGFDKVLVMIGICFAVFMILIFINIL